VVVVNTFSGCSRFEHLAHTITKSYCNYGALVIYRATEAYTPTRRYSERKKENQQYLHGTFQFSIHINKYYFGKPDPLEDVGYWVRFEVLLELFNDDRLHCGVNLVTELFYLHRGAGKSMNR
jgi:hypothetical protein